MSKSSSTKRSIILLFVFVVSVALVASDLIVMAQNGNGNTQGEPTRGGQMTSNANTQGNTTSTGRRSGRRRGTRTGNMGNANASTVSGADASGNMNVTMQGNANMGGDQTGDMTNNNMGAGNRRRRGRRGGNANMAGDMSGNANVATSTDMSANTSGGGRRGRRRRGGAGTTMTGTTTTTTTTTTGAESVQTDLSGTYTGTLGCSGIGTAGEGTLAITGNQFTWTPSAGGSPVNGRIVAVTTRGYTAVAMQVGESVAPPPGQTSTPPMIVSLRARKMGDRLSLTSIANGAKDCGFNPGGATMGGTRRRGRRRS